MADPWVWFICLIAAPVGSFMAVLADRKCSGQSLLSPSACSQCGTRLAARDLIPLYSWFALRARCRTCGAKIPNRLLAAEALALGAAFLAIASTFTAVQSLCLAVFLWSLIGLVLCDLGCFRLPDALTGLALVAALFLAALEGRIEQAILGGSLGLAVFWVLRWGYRNLRGHEGLGLGDVKLAAGLGAAVGAEALPWLGLGASGFGLVLAAFGAWGGLNAEARQPFGVLLCVTCSLILIWQRLI